MTNATPKPPKFDGGTFVATPAALAVVPQSIINAAMRRHFSGDWGDLCASDKAMNDACLREGDQIMSVYSSFPGIPKFYVITEADRSVTTVLLPSDY